jgi:uncharacterized protein (DUF58 family)
MVATMLLIGLAALNTAAPLLYLMFSMMCAFFVLSAMLATNSIRRLSVDREAARVWLAGQPMPVTIRVRNGKRLTSSCSLRIEDVLEDGTVQGAVFFDLVPPGGQPAIQRYECVFLRRGLYRMRELELATRFPFGLIERVLRFRAPAEVLVLPQSISLGKRIEQARADLGEYQGNRRGQGAGLYGLRAYTPEFSARDIHWKISARRGQLVVREYEAEERRRAVVVLDNRIAEPQDAEAAEKFEMAIILATSVVEWLLANDHEVELRTASGIVAFGSGLPHLTRCRRCLAQLMPIPPGESVANTLLHGGEEGVVLFPILMGPSQTAEIDCHPVSVTDYQPQLMAALAGKDGSTA